MNIDLESLSTAQTYFAVTQTLVPRPIAWVLSEHENSGYNLAPFSYFSAISSAPPLVMISVGKKPDGSHKDTRVNIEQRHHFVIHIPSVDQLEPMNLSSETLAADISEVDKLGLATCKFDGFPLPRLEQAKVAFGCVLHQIQEIGDTPQSLIIGRIQQIYIDDQIVSHTENGRFKIDSSKLNPIARLGGSEYWVDGKVVSVKRP